MGLLYHKKWSAFNYVSSLMQPGVTSVKQSNILRDLTVPWSAPAVKRDEEFDKKARLKMFGRKFKVHKIDGLMHRKHRKPPPPRKKKKYATSKKFKIKDNLKNIKEMLGFNS